MSLRIRLLELPTPNALYQTCRRTRGTATKQLPGPRRGRHDSIEDNELMPAPALILFDIDGTLLRRAGPHHREALVEAVRKVTGLETTTDNVPVAGMLDRDILRAML